MHNELTLKHTSRCSNFSEKVNNIIFQFTLMVVILLSYNINTDKWRDSPSNTNIHLLQHSQHVLGHLQHRQQAVK